MTDGEAYVMFALERLKVCGPKMAILGREGPHRPELSSADDMCVCDYCGGPEMGCRHPCPVETIEQGVKR